MANLILIPPNSNTFSNWRRTCYVSWVNKHLMTNPRETVSFVSTTTSLWNVEVEGKQNSLFPAKSDLWHVTRSPPPNSKLPVFMWRNYIPKLKIAFPSEVLVSSDYRLYRNLAFYNVLALQGSSFCTWVKKWIIALVFANGTILALEEILLPRFGALE